MPNRPSSRCAVSPRCNERAVYRGRCKEHAQEAERERGSGWQRYPEPWRRSVAEAKEGRVCVDCGTEGTADNPLTGDHTVPLKHGGEMMQAPVIRCRRCNSKRGAPAI